MGNWWKKADGSTDDSAVAEKVDGMQAKIDSLEKTNIALAKASEKSTQQVTVEKYATAFKSKEAVANFKDGTSYTDSLVALLGEADTYCKNVAESFEKTAPKKGGSVSADDMDDTAEPRDLREAVEFVKENNKDLKGTDLIAKCKIDFPQFYKKGKK